MLTNEQLVEMLETKPQPAWHFGTVEARRWPAFGNVAD